MTEQDSCPEISVLSAFLDGEIDVGESASIEAHTANCPDCAKRLTGLRTVTEQTGATLEGLIELRGASQSPRCVSGTVLSSYLHDILTAEERREVENHLDSCDLCLSDLSALARTDRVLHCTSPEPVPKLLREKVESFWMIEKNTTDQILKIICNLAQEGIEFLRDSLLPRGLTFQELFASSGAYRSPGGRSKPSSIMVKGQLADTHFGLSIDWERQDKAGLKLQLEDEKSTPLPSQRVFLRRENVLIHSERTDVNGTLQLSNLNPGVYQLAIVISGKEFPIGIEIRRD